MSEAIPQPVRRSPADFLRLVVAFASDLLRGLDAVPHWIVDVIVVGTRIFVVVVLGGGLLWIVHGRRWRMLLTVVAAGALAVAVYAWVDTLIDSRGADIV